MTATKTALNVSIAQSIASYAHDWKMGNMAPLDAEVRKYLGVDALRRIEGAIRGSSNPKQAAYDAAILELA